MLFSPVHNDHMKPCHLNLLLEKVKKSSQTFTVTGFSYWNDGHRKLAKHEESDDHKECVKQLTGGDKSQPKIDISLDASIATSRVQNATMLTHVIRALKFLTKQNLAIRGTATQGSTYTEPNSNLIQVSNQYNYAKCLRWRNH